MLFVLIIITIGIVSCGNTSRIFINSNDDNTLNGKEELIMKPIGDLIQINTIRDKVITNGVGGIRIPIKELLVSSFFASKAYEEHNEYNGIKDIKAGSYVCIRLNRKIDDFECNITIVDCLGNSLSFSINPNDLVRIYLTALVYDNQVDDER